MNPKFPQRCPEVPVTALRIELALTLPIRAIRIGARYIRIRADICNSRARARARVRFSLPVLRDLLDTPFLISLKLVLLESAN